MGNRRTVVLISWSTIILFALGPGATLLRGHTPQADGKTMYEDECASCHGKQGRGNGRAGRDMDPRPTDITDPEYFAGTTRAEMIEIIVGGNGEMDPFEDIFTAEEIESIMDYVEHLMERRRK